MMRSLAVLSATPTQARLWPMARASSPCSVVHDTAGVVAHCAAS